jgi:hypothetical protein
MTSPKLAFFAAMFFSSVPMFGSTLMYNVPSTAQAVIDITGTTLKITLTDLVVNPTSVIQNISGFTLSFNQNESASTTLSSSSSILRTVASNGSYTDGGSAVSPAWAIQLLSAAISLDDLGAGGAGPAHTIIGAPGAGNTYSAANGSIAGNGPHDPFIDQTATWTFSVPNLASLTVTGASFQFGTTDQQNIVTGVKVATPEPASLALFAAGALLLGLGRKRFARKSPTA